MKRLLTLLFILPLFILITGCPGCGVPESVGACGVANPIENLVWLKADVDAAKASDQTIADHTLFQGTYKGATVFWIYTCCPVCDMMPPKVKKCDGSVAGQFMVDIQDSEVTNRTEIWRTNNGVCK